MAQMKRVVIIYAPDDEIVQQSAVAIKSTFVNEHYSVTIKHARDAHMPDFAGVEIVILGSNKEDKRSIHTDFTEIIRALKGINLAGRIAGIFSFDTDETEKDFIKALYDSGISIFEKGLLIKDGKIDTKVIKDWVKQIITGYHRKDRNGTII
jgi:flavodoxin